MKRDRSISLISVGVSSEFYLYLINFNISTFDDVTMFLRRKRKSEFLQKKNSHHSKISECATWFFLSKHSDKACFYPPRTEKTRRGF